MSIDIDKNKSFCIFPFDHSYIGSRYERKLCCISKDIEGLTKTTNKEFWNSEKMKQVRLDMLNGVLIDECKVCYENEEAGLSSLRMQSTKPLQKNNAIDEYIKETDTSTGFINNDPLTFDYRTIHCNLQCISCGYHYSSTHINLAKKMKKDLDDFVVDFSFEENMFEEIKKSILEKKCGRIYWAGGEPMSSMIHWKVVELLYDLSKDPEYKNFFNRLNCHYNTNMTKLYWKGKLIPELIEFYQPTMQCSIDGTHETFEYCRDGASWDEVSKNWDIYYQHLNKKNQFGIATVLSAPVIFDIDRWFDFFEKYNPVLYNHKLFVGTEYNMSNDKKYIGDNILDIRIFPDHISIPALDHAIKRFEKSNLRNKERTITILNLYKTERKNKPEIFNNKFLLHSVKTKTLYRDNFLIKSKSFGDVLSKINPVAYEWYRSL